MHTQDNLEIIANVLEIKMIDCEMGLIALFILGSYFGVKCCDSSTGHG